MFSQYELPLSDASPHAPARSGILTPASDTSLNLSDGFFSGPRKRKRDGNTMGDLLKDSFVVKPYPTTVFVKPRTLQPLMLLPRSRLPLAFLDFTPSANALPQSRLFETHIKILELEERMGNQPMLLIARLEDGRTLYAAEREDRGLYVLCQLGSWVNMQQLRDIAVVSRQDSEKGLRQSSTHEREDALPTTTLESRKYDTKKRLAIEAIQSMVKRPPSAIWTNSQACHSQPPDLETQVMESQTQCLLTEYPAVVEAAIEVAAPPSSTDVFDSLRTQYLESLYLSKASLAYFAKGPISRARAAFHLDYDSTLEMKDLVSFLESLVLTTNVLDKKYREGLPTCVSMIDIHDHSANDANEAASKRKRRKSTKVKLGKNGLFPSEEPLIRKWWSNHDDDAESRGPGVTREDLTKHRIAELRVRETQLQLIVVLEVLALQPLASQDGEAAEELPLASLPTGKTQSKEKQPKSKKTDRLAMLIDVHIDRLCIWQSIRLEASKPPDADSQIQDTSSALQASKNTDNVLRDFCVEVIAPFFSARLPERCAMINRKLGGPVAISPPRPRLSKSSSFSVAPSRPGAATKRPVPVKPRRSLQRVLTDERERRSISRGPERAMSLLRSATMPAIPSIKRENSEAPSLSGIPYAASQTVEGNRSGVIKSKQLARREVDLGSLVPSISSKASKQARIEVELKNAISALKKPNRELAGKDIVETAERRSATTSHIRKSRKPVGNPLFQGVQITATPKANRTKNTLYKPMSQSAQSQPSLEMEMIPLSSIPRVQQSVSKGSDIKNPLFSSLQATPTRRSSNSSFKDFLDAGKGKQPVFQPSPLHVRRTSAQLFRAVPDSAINEVSSSQTCPDIQDTPVKKGLGTALSHGHPALLDKENVSENEVAQAFRGEKVTRQEDSIYKSLGWDDADDLI
ncbi:DNA replication regulator SLD3-domain-containing protein [Amylocarpus encephaloides]|uniref:DNA replication regulator SLD3-domain-containing protein n=1 Tax=Amylocarpus encephaloides TaxID=45428 RepID=A0A9P7YSA1_9HELO|nr:DNA replication regulator SLD3-domain-containing protein [Amylocarpus encephaloides]